MLNGANNILGKPTEFEGDSYEQTQWLERSEMFMGKQEFSAS
jgi:hypothetical protein